jgi:hypothetical protein
MATTESFDDYCLRMASEGYVHKDDTFDFINKNYDRLRTDWLRKMREVD